MTTLTELPSRKSNSPVLKREGQQAGAVNAGKKEQIIARNAIPAVYRYAPQFKSLREVSKKGLWSSLRDRLETFRSTLRRVLKAFRHLLAGPPMTDQERFEHAVQGIRTEKYKMLGGGFTYLRPR